MPIKLYRPTTSARRHTSILKDVMISDKRPEKALVYPRKKFSGRNNTGSITVRHKGGGAKQFVRIIDFKRDKFDIPATIVAFEYDPNRNTRIALLNYADGAKRYIIASQEMKVGDKLMSSKKAITIQAGNRMPLRFIPTGMFIHDLELAVNGGGKLCRSAGNAATLMALDGVKAQVKLPSGEIRLLSQDCSATIGVPSNPEAFNVRWGKAGRMRHRGIKPTVRGKVMNPVDHPHGGGEAKNSIGLKYPKTYTGKHALGVRTRKSKKYSNRLIVKRRSK